MNYITARWAKLFLLFLFIGSCCLSAAFISNIPRMMQIYVTMKRNNHKTVFIKRLNKVSIGRTASFYVHFEYNNKEQSIRVPYHIYNASINKKTISLVHSDSYPDLFLHDEYDYRKEIFNSAVLIALFILCSVIILYYILKI